MVADGFEWDDDKAAANLAKHGVSFDEGLSVVQGLLSATQADPSHSDDEDRELAIGYSALGRCLVVSYTDRGGNVRIISARPATRREQRGFDDGTYG